MLVKFWPLPKGEIDLAELSKNGIVDVAFPGLIQGAEFDTWLLGRKDYSGIRSLLIEKKLGYESLRLEAGLRTSGKYGLFAWHPIYLSRVYFQLIGACT